MSICRRLCRVHHLYLQVCRLSSNIGSIGDVDTVTNEDVTSPQISAEDKKNNMLSSASFHSELHSDISTESASSLSNLQINNRVLDSTKEISDFMTKNDIPFRHGQTCFFAVCPKFGKLAMKAMKDKDCIYINSISGYFHCKKCGASGEWSHLKDNIASIPSKSAARKTHVCFKDVQHVNYEVAESPKEVTNYLAGAQDFSQLSDEEFENILFLFDWQGLHRATFQKYGVKLQLENGKYKVIFPVQSPQGVVTSLRVRSGSLSEEGDISIQPVYNIPRSKKQRDLFGWQLMDHAAKKQSKNQVVITDSEVNAMAIFQETGILSIVLDKVSQLPQEVLPHLESYEKITLWLGKDITAWQNAKPFALKLNEKRVFIFRPTILKQMPLECVQLGSSMQGVLAEACLISHKDILSTSYLRDEVLAELQQFDKVCGVKWRRYEKLNDIFKGHRRGELTVLTGPTGSGKTTFVCEYSLDLCMQGVNTLWGSFEINNVRLIKCMLQQFAGKNIAKHLNDFDDIYNEFSNLPMFFMRHFGQQDINQVIDVMTQAVYIHDISHVVIDNLQFMMGMDFNEMNRWVKQDQIVSAFRRFATEKNCHVTIIMHPRKVREGEALSTAAIFGSAKVTQEADNIILIQDQRLDKVNGKKFIQPCTGTSRLRTYAR
ncbi:twinkle mtDNA helicase-like isoform X2 [Dreissena polymorpha]|uniref:twinkle mtDNA helicase-like isoform X2 n=1 Tax=Dreissena polymorpha TaxID=45954 RepID=UPI0022646F8E|nr:twinkle mtDNA helicase-like isoform X2 [Dreissena polymorpha]